MVKRILLIALMLQTSVAAGPAFACTGFCVSDGGTVLVGNNEDWYNPLAMVWFEPAEEGKYGRVYFGFSRLLAFGGMNDQGLFFDYFATPPLEVSLSKHKEKYKGNLMNKVMEECATVEEALALIGKYNLEFMKMNQTMLADKTGDSVIIEGDSIIRKKGSYQVVTNFYQSKVQGTNYPCERYKIAVDMMENCPGISVDYCRRILAATHQEAVRGRRGVINTVYSNIYDLEKELVYVCLFHNYENEIVFDLNEELKKGRHSYDLNSLFPKTYAAESFLREYMKRRAAKRKQAK